MMEHPGCGDMVDDRYCHKCIWHDGECMIWNCDYISRESLRKAIKAGLDLKGLVKEVETNGRY